MPGFTRTQLNLPLKWIFVKLGSAGSLVATSRMSDAFRRFASASISSLVAWPMRIHVSVAAPAPAAAVWFHLPTYSVPADRSAGRSARNMKRPPLVASSPIITVRRSGITWISSCEIRPRQ